MVFAPAFHREAVPARYQAMASSAAQMGWHYKLEAVSICGLVITLRFVPSRLAGFERSSQTEAPTSRTQCSLAQAWFFDSAGEPGREEPIREQSPHLLDCKRMPRNHAVDERPDLHPQLLRVIH